MDPVEQFSDFSRIEKKKCICNMKGLKDVIMPTSLHSVNFPLSGMYGKWGVLVT
jgi:hypothetical protein